MPHSEIRTDLSATPQQHERVLPPKAKYHAQWRAFAIRHGVALALLYSWIPAALAFFLAASRQRLAHPLLACALLSLWLFAALAATWWAGEFRCPRCQRRYAALGYGNKAMTLTRGLFDKVCANCKLTKFERVR